MVYAGIISYLIEFLLCVLYGVVVLTVIPECTEAIVFHFRIVTDAYVSAREQIRSLKLVVGLRLLDNRNCRYNHNKVWGSS